MRYWTYLIVGMVLVLVGCQDEVQTGNTVNNSNTENVTLLIPEETPPIAPTQSPALTPSPSPTARPLSLRSSLRQISFGQSNETVGYMFRTLNNSDLTDETYPIVRHMEEFSIRLDLLEGDRLQKEHLLSKITLEGNAQTRLDIDPMGAVLRLTRMDDVVTVTIGDIPPIQILKAEPLQLKVETTHFKDESIVLAGDPEQNPALRAVVVSNLETHLTLSFSEEMDQAIMNGMPKGEWLDSRRYRVELAGGLMVGNERVENGVSLIDFRSIRGNYTAVYDWNLGVHRVQPGVWRDVGTGEKIGWSPRDTFYETIIFSPDRNRYIGTVAIGRPDGDGDGFYYVLVLEERGKVPKFIETSIYLNVLQQGSPVQWIDNDRILYADYRTIYEYSISTGERRIILERDGDEGGYHSVTYDLSAGQLHVMTHQYEETWDHKGQVVVNTYVYNGLAKPAISEQLRSAVIGTSNGYMSYRMTVYPVQSGTFHTTIQEDGRPITHYDSQTGGKRVLPGQVYYADNKMVLLLENYLFQSDGQVDYRLWIWNYGETEPIAAPLPPGSIRIAGSQPIAGKDEVYYRYDSQNNEWQRWANVIGERILTISPQTSIGMYKAAR